MTLTREEMLRYAQQLNLSEIGKAGQEKLKSARVLCVGAGGLGTPLLLYLAVAGVGTIGIIDEDRLELSNLHRQVLYQTADIGMRKALLAQQQLLALNPHLSIHTYIESLSASNARTLMQSYDIVADCTDNFSSRYLINDICYSLNKPWIFASVSQFSGQCSVFLGESSACFRCLFPTIPAHNPFLNCNVDGIIGVVPGLLGMIQATEILKWILKIGKLLVNRLLVIDSLNMHFQHYNLVKNPQCQICGMRASVETLLA